MVFIETERLVLRAARQADLPEHHRLLSDAKTMYHLQDIMTHSEEESARNLAEAMAALEEMPRERLFLTMERRCDGAYLGQIGYTVVEAAPPGKVVHAGYFMLPDYHGKGYVTEAFLALIDFAFAQDGVMRLNTGCFAENKASERVMQKCGMVKEGDYPACTWHDGAMKGRLAYRLLREEWEAARCSR